MWEIKFRVFYLLLVVIGEKNSVRTSIFPTLGALLVGLGVDVSGVI